VLNENSESPLHGEIKLFGVGRGRVAQAPLAEELKGIFTALDALGGRQSDRFRDSAHRFFLQLLQAGRRRVPARLGRAEVQHQDGRRAARLPARRADLLKTVRDAAAIR
jgi:hypothetical protein